MEVWAEVQPLKIVSECLLNSFVIQLAGEKSLKSEGSIRSCVGKYRMRKWAASETNPTVILSKIKDDPFVSH